MWSWGGGAGIPRYPLNLTLSLIIIIIIIINNIIIKNNNKII